MRPNAKELLKHKFITKAKKTQILAELVQRKRDAIIAKLIREGGSLRTGNSDASKFALKREVANARGEPNISIDNAKVLRGGLSSRDSGRHNYTSSGQKGSGVTVPEWDFEDEDNAESMKKK